MNSGSSNQATRGQSTLLPADQVAEQFGKVYVRKDGKTLHVEFTIWVRELEGGAAEGWQTGVALDASASMKNWFGRNLTGSLPQTASLEYQSKGWIREEIEDGRKVFRFKPEAYEDAIKQGHLKYTENIVEPLARDFIGYLAGSLDADGGTTVIYWACGDGSGYEFIGDFTTDQCKTLEIRGPKKTHFGSGTRLVPAVKYFVDRFADAERGMYVFITDGKLDDLAELKKYTKQLAINTAAGKQKPIKCVLIGVGDSIDEKQMEELDDLDTGTDVDIWDHKIARDMRDLSEIIAELVDENQIVAPLGVIYDDRGNIAARFTDGLPARVAFSMPATSAYFDLEVAGQRIRQTVQT